MPGPIALLGGLEHYEPMMPIDRQLLDDVGVAAPNVVVLPVASFPRQVAATGALACSHWARLGTRVQVVLPRFGGDHRAVEAVSTADVIVLPGGVPDRLVAALHRTPIWNALVARWQGGAGVTGSSAGAIALFERRVRLYPPNPFRLVPGLGLLHGYVAGPHFDRFRVSKWVSPVVNHLGGLGVIGLDESTGLVGRDGSMRVLGKGTVTIATQSGIRAYPAGEIIGLRLTAPAVSSLSQPSSTERDAA